eukprot:TRINITY_DN16713_c0_g1_i14.p1 TRINITY_DN16713_c0_g1~~TRINITY_DN16713_c0_g1_i14.p1  ORF type:complete len:838 (+),score=208.03 TRINITY_DN16713_c0_g1_i14:263-2776(+)
MSDDKEAARLRFQQLFKQADLDNDGVINGRDAAEFFRRLHLPDGFLKKVCVLSDVKRQGSLGQSEFYTALQLIFLCRLDFASSSDEAYIQDWKEILQLMLVNGVIFPVPPSRAKMLKIFEETVAKHGIVTGAQVRAIFGRSSLRQDLFKSLCDMFGMVETKIVDDDLFIRFGMAVQLLLHAMAAARKARSGRSTPRASDHGSAPARTGQRTPRGGEGAQTPREGWSRPTPATPREEPPTSNGHAPAEKSPSVSLSPRPAPGSTLTQAAVAKRSAELLDADAKLKQATADHAGHHQQHSTLEQQLSDLNEALDTRKAEHDRVVAQTEQLRAAIAELNKEKQETQALYDLTAQHSSEALAALEKEKASHSHLLNSALKQALEAVRERDAEIARLREAQSAPPVEASWAQHPPMGATTTPKSAAAIANAEQQIAEASEVFDGGWGGRDPFAQQPAMDDPFAPQQSSGLDRSAIPVLEEQRTGGSIISQSFARTAPLGGGGGQHTHRDRDELSDSDTIFTGFTAVSTEYGETPRPEFVSEASMAQLGSSITVDLDSICMKGIRRLNKPFVTVCVVDADGRMLTNEQATGPLTTTSEAPDTFVINQKFVVPVPDDGALAGSCALIFKLRQLQKRTGAPNSRCWVPLELRDVLHQHGLQSVSLSLYQKPTDLKRKRMFPEGKQSKIVFKITTPDLLAGSEVGSTENTMDQTLADLAGFTPGGDAAPAECDLSHREPTPEELERAVELFNEKPKKGLQYMTDNGFFRAPPDNLHDIVRFLLEPQGMSKYQIGQYLGTRAELPEQVLTAFVASLDFENKSFDDCVRMYFKAVSYTHLTLPTKRIV